eukprot:2903700-Rhodomonas_salina.1
MMLSAYAMCGTTLAYAAVCLRTSYAMCGTELAYTAMGLRCYAVCGTDLGVWGRCAGGGGGGFTARDGRGTA